MDVKALYPKEAGEAITHALVERPDTNTDPDVILLLVIRRMMDFTLENNLENKFHNNNK